MKRKLRHSPAKCVSNGEDKKVGNVASLGYTDGGCRRYTELEARNCEQSVVEGAQDVRALSTLHTSRPASILCSPALTGTVGTAECSKDADLEHGRKRATPAIVQTHGDVEPCGMNDRYPFGEEATTEQVEYWTLSEKTKDLHVARNGGRPPKLDAVVKQDRGLDHMDELIYSEWLIYSQAHEFQGCQVVGDSDLPTRTPEGAMQSICDKSKYGGQSRKRCKEPKPESTLTLSSTKTKNPVHCADKGGSETTALQNGQRTNCCLSFGVDSVVKHRDTRNKIAAGAVGDGDGDAEQRASAKQETGRSEDTRAGRRACAKSAGVVYDEGSEHARKSSWCITWDNMGAGAGAGTTVIDDGSRMSKMGWDTTHPASPSRTDDSDDGSGNPDDNGPHRHTQQVNDPMGSNSSDTGAHKHRGCESETRVTNSSDLETPLISKRNDDHAHTTRYGPRSTRWYDLEPRAGAGAGLEFEQDASRRRHARYSWVSRVDFAHRRHPPPPHDYCVRNSRRGRGWVRDRGSPPFVRYRSSGGGSSGLGGYSPRRRRFKNAAHTPSPPPRTPERKKCRAWDLPPSALDAHNDAAGEQAKLDGFLLAATCRAGLVSPCACPFAIKAKSSSLVSGRKQQQQQQQQQLCTSFAPLTSSQAPRTLRRLYIGNVPITVSDGELLEFLNAAMLSANISSIPGTKPCVNCSVHIEKNYAFAEFVTPEDATAAMAFDGVMLHGTVLKIKRPKDYVQPVNGSPIPVPNLVSNVVPDSVHKIFLGGISFSLSAHKDKVKEIVTSFGQLKAFHWEVDSTRSPPQVYAFFEYVDPKVTLKACAGLNGLPVANSIWTCVQATPDASAKMLDKASYLVPPSAVRLLQAPTRILELQNLVSEEEFLSMTETGVCEYVEDVRLECSRFGRIKGVHMTRPPTSSTATSPTDSQQVVDVPGTKSRVDEQRATKQEGPLTQPGSSNNNNQCVGRVYVQFAREDSALRAASCLHGRMYGDKKAVAGYFPTEATFGKFTVPVAQVSEKNDTHHCAPVM